jgi:YVTN family beta-propeller protein
MKIFFSFMVVAYIVSGCLVAPASARRLIFVANLADDTVSVIDGDLDREVEIIPVGNAPHSLALRESDPPLVAVANSRSRHATLIDPVTLEVLPESPPTGMGPEAVAFSPDGKTLIATSYYDKTVTFTDLANNMLDGPPIEFTGIPRRLEISPDGQDLLVLVHALEGAVAVVDLATRKVEKSIPVGRFPSDFAFSPDGTQLIAASFDDSTVTFIDLASRRPVKTPGAGGGVREAVGDLLPGQGLPD